MKRFRITVIGDEGWSRTIRCWDSDVIRESDTTFVHVTEIQPGSTLSIFTQVDIVTNIEEIQ